VGDVSVVTGSVVAMIQNTILSCAALRHALTAKRGEHVGRIGSLSVVTRLSA